MDREYEINSLHVGFQYDKDEIAKYLDSGIKYLELKKICMHAFAARVPLAHVVAMREKYCWTRVAHDLGVDAATLEARTMDYKAERLERVYGLDQQLTRKYMAMGYASHQVRMAINMARYTDMPIEDILALKTRQQKWGDLCEQLGLSRDACRE